MATKKPAPKKAAAEPDPAAPRRFFRSKDDRVLAGVCGGLAKYFNIDPTLVRVLWVVLTLVSAGAGIIAYIILWLVAPEE